MLVFAGSKDEFAMMLVHMQPWHHIHGKPVPWVKFTSCWVLVGLPLVLSLSHAHPQIENKLYHKKNTNLVILISTMLRMLTLSPALPSYDGLFRSCRAWHVFYPKYLKLHFQRILVVQSKCVGGRGKQKCIENYLQKYLACTDLPNMQVQRAPEVFAKSKSLLTNYVCKDSKTRSTLCFFRKDTLQWRTHSVLQKCLTTY